jgi:hypothetical protein
VHIDGKPLQTARFAQRDLRGNRRAAASLADRPSRHCREEGVAAMRRIVIIVVVIVVVAVGAFAWRTFTRGPLAFAGGSTVALTDYHEADPTGVPADLTGADAVRRGEYLAKAADCVVCHTSPGGEAFAGGLAFRLPFGTLYSTNITVDENTGIGTYSDQDFLNAVQRGIRKDGVRLYPAMPYTSYTFMIDADALAIKAYLFSRSAKSAEWNRGAYMPKRWRIAASVTPIAILLLHWTTAENSRVPSPPVGARLPADRLRREKQIKRILKQPESE